MIWKCGQHAGVAVLGAVNTRIARVQIKAKNDQLLHRVALLGTLRT